MVKRPITAQIPIGVDSRSRFCQPPSARRRQNQYTACPSRTRRSKQQETNNPAVNDPTTGLPRCITTFCRICVLEVGAIAGVLAGLLGVGGGLMIVPMLMFCFTRLGLPPSRSCIWPGDVAGQHCFTSVSSFWSHHRRGAVVWVAVRRIVPGILVGTFCGTFVASQLSTAWLKGFFSVFMAYVAVQMLLDKKPAPSRASRDAGNVRRRQRDRAGVESGGHRRRNAVGAVSALVQPDGAPRDRHFGRDRVSDRRRGELGIPGQRLAGRLAAAGRDGLRVPAGPGLHCVPPAC